MVVVRDREGGLLESWACYCVHSVVAFPNDEGYT